MRLLHYSDLENAYDRTERIGRLAGCIEEHRDRETVVVGTGDDVGPCILAMAEDGRQALDFFEAVRPDVETFGNHDSDYGLDALREIVGESPQTWISANVRDDGDPFADVPATALVERGDESVGFVGVTDPASSVPDELTVTDPVDAVREGVSDLQSAGADWTVALAHLRDERLRELAVSTDVDVVLAGHVHSERRDRFEDTLVVRPGANGRVVWEVELDDGVEATRLDVESARPSGVPLHDEMVERLRVRMAETGLGAVVDSVSEPMIRERERWFAGEHPLANFVGDAYRWVTGADVGFFDTRMLRESRPLYGEVTVADVMGLAPFDVDLCVTELPGTKLRELAEQAVATDERARRSPTAEAWWAHFGGMSVVWNRDAESVRVVRVDREPLDLDASYTVATTAYVTATDEFPAVTREQVTDVWGVQYDALAEYARQVGIESARDGRIVVEE